MSIENKKTNLKNIIKKTAASASVLALLVGGTTEALGTDYTTNATNAGLATGANPVNTDNAATKVADGDSAILKHTPVFYGATDNKGKNAATTKLNLDNQSGGVVDLIVDMSQDQVLLNGKGNDIDVTIQNAGGGNSLFVSGTDLSAYRSFTMAKGERLVFDKLGETRATIDGGTLAVRGDMVFTGAIGGGTAVEQVLVSDKSNATFKNDMFVDAGGGALAFGIGDDGILKFDADGSDRTIQSKNAKADFIDSKNTGKGVVAFTDTSGSTDKKITLKKLEIGNTNQVKSITVENVTVDVSEAVKTDNGAGIGTGTLELKENGKLVVSKAAGTIDADIQIKGTEAAPSEIKGIINPAAANQAKIMVTGVGTIDANGAALDIGKTQALDSINFTESGAKLTIKGSTNAGTIKTKNGIEFTKDNTTLEVTGDQSLRLVVMINSKDTGGHGTITSNIPDGKKLSFDNAIGKVNADNSLGALTITSGDVWFGAESHIKVLKLDGNGNVELSGNARSAYRFDSIELSNSDTNKIILHNDTIISGGVDVLNIGSSDKKWASVDLAGHELSISGNVNVYSSRLENSIGAADLVFSKNSIFSAPVTQAGVIQDIIVTGNVGEVVRITENIIVDRNVIFDGSDGSVIQFEGETVTGTGGVMGDAASTNTGIVRFAHGAGNQTVDYEIGSKVSDVRFIGKNVEFKKDFDAKGISFTADTKSNVEVTFVGDIGLDVKQTALLKGANVAAARVVSNNSSFTPTLKVDADQEFGPNFQVIGSGNTVILGTDDKQFNIGSTKMSKAIIQTAVKDQNEVFMTKQNAVLSQVGSESKPVKELYFQQSGTVSNGSWAKGIFVDTGKTATFGGTVHSDQLHLGVVGKGGGGFATANFNDGVILNAKVDHAIGAMGVANFAGSATLNEDVGAQGNLAEINFSASGDQTVIFNNSVLSATNLTFKDGKHLVNSEELFLDGNSMLNGSNIDLKSNELISTDGSLIAKNNITLGFEIKPSANGSVSITKQSELNVKELKSLAINITQTGNFDVFGDQKVVLLDASKAAEIVKGSVDLASIVSNANVQINGGLGLTVWTAALSDDGKQIILKQAQDVASVTSKVTGDAGAASILSNPANANLTNQLAGMLGDSNASEDMKVARFREAMNRIQDTNGESENQDLEGAQVVASDMVNNHLHGDLMLSADAVQVSSLDDSTGEGIAAGSCEVHDRFKSGLWLSPFYRSAEQKRRKGVSGYDSSVSGISIGADTMVNNDLRLGTAFTYAHSSLKHKNVRKGDKGKIDSYLFSIYAMQYVTNNAFVQGIATVGANTVRGNSKRVLNVTTNEIAKSKYNSMSFSFEGMSGYNYMVQDFVLTPMAGLRFMRVNDGGYTESGTANSNLKVSKKAAHRFDLIAGGRVIAPKFMVADMNMTPEAHGFITHDFVGKNPQSDVRLEYSAVPFPKKSKNPAKTSYNLGLSLNAEQGMMEYSLGYDFHAAEKFTAHQTTFKVRVNF